MLKRQRTVPEQNQQQNSRVAGGLECVAHLGDLSLEPLAQEVHTKHHLLNLLALQRDRSMINSQLTRVWRAVQMRSHTGPDVGIAQKSKHKRLHMNIQTKMKQAHSNYACVTDGTAAAENAWTSNWSTNCEGEMMHQ